MFTKVARIRIEVVFKNKVRKRQTSISTGRVLFQGMKINDLEISLMW